MRRIQCNKGHIYDADVYSTCPYCGDFQAIQFGDMTAENEVRVGQAGGTAPVGTMSAENIGKTVPIGYQQSKTSPPRTNRGVSIEEEQKTIGVMGRRQGIEPVVGWLVCVEGKEKGKDFRLYGKINTVGRNETMDVCIKGDPGITREVHVRVSYDPRHNNFYLIPANSSNNTYLNDSPVYVPTEMHAYDILELGETKLVFVPLCNQNFSWNQ